jgi:hypothetical protein
LHHCSSTHTRVEYLCTLVARTSNCCPDRGVVKKAVQEKLDGTNIMWLADVLPMEGVCVDASSVRKAACIAAVACAAAAN